MHEPAKLTSAWAETDLRVYAGTITVMDALDEAKCIKVKDLRTQLQARLVAINGDRGRVAETKKIMDALGVKPNHNHATPKETIVKTATAKKPTATAIKQIAYINLTTVVKRRKSTVLINDHRARVECSCGRSFACRINADNVAVTPYHIH
jgi:hypothetical protein